MADTRKWIQSIDVLQDEDGAIRVALPDGALSVDLATVDVTALIAGIAGNKTLADVITDLSAAVAALPQDAVVVAAYRLTVTSTPAALPTLAGATLPAGLLAIALLREEDSTAAVRMAIGASAGASSPEVPGGGMVLSMTKTVADSVQLYAATTTYVTLLALAPRS